MVMTVYGQEIPCQRAEKGADFVRAYDEGGAWSAAEPTDGERIGELEALVAQLLFGGEGE